MRCYIPYIYIHVYTRFIDGVTMFRAIKTVARVDDEGASVSIRRQLTPPRNPDKTNGKLASHVGRNITHAATLSDYSDLRFFNTLSLRSLTGKDLCSRRELLGEREKLASIDEA